IADVSVLGGTDSLINIVQSNGGADGTAADDADIITAPQVIQDSNGEDGFGPGGGLEGLDQIASADGTEASATAGSGVVTSGDLISTTEAGIGDDAFIDGAANASAGADAALSGFEQGIETGDNTQANGIAAAIIGSHRNANVVGEDDVAGGDDAAIGGVSGDADTLFSLSQSNMLLDDDQVLDALVQSQGGDSIQDASAQGGSAMSGDGVTANGVGGSGSVGDDIVLNGSTIASADASADTSIFTQDISTGGNVQVNDVDASVVGINDSLFFAGEDDEDDATDLPALSALTPLEVGDPDGELAGDGNGTDTMFSIDQVNSLMDNDMVTSPTVSNEFNTDDVSQTVSVTGGQATSGDGIGGDGSLFGSFDVGDDLLIDGSSEASADAFGAADAFSQNIVVGANIQVNTVDVSVVGGSTVANITGDDDA
ncbi:MAG: hypothetical protein AAFW47_02775, partial [Pseudomonadota bacterium]